MGTIIRITQFPHKKGEGVELIYGNLRENHGLEGDAFADGGERQISLLSREALESIQSGAQGLCTARYKHSLLIDGISQSDMREGARFFAGDAVLEISAVAKKCFDKCPLAASGKPCALSGQHLFAKVVKSGRIRCGDEFGAV